MKQEKAFIDGSWREIEDSGVLKDYADWLWRVATLVFSGFALGWFLHGVW